MSSETISNGLSVGSRLADYANELSDSTRTETVTNVYQQILNGAITQSRTTDERPIGTGETRSFSQLMGLESPEMLSPADLALLLKAVQSKVEQDLIKLSKTDIERIQSEQKDQAEVRLKNLQETIEQIEKANKSGDIGKIFSWIAAGLMVLAGAILLATGVAAAAGAALLIGGVAMMVALALQIPDENGVTPMDKWIGAMADAFAAGGLMTEEQAHGLAIGIAAAIFVAASAPAFIFAGPAGGIAVLGSLLPLLVTPENLQQMGMNEEDAQKLSLGLTIGIAVVAIAVTAGPALASGVSSAAGRLSAMAADMSDNVSSFLANVSSKAGTFSQAAQSSLGPIARTAERISTTLASRLQTVFGLSDDALALIGKAGGYGAQIGQSTATIGSGVANAVATDYAHDAKETEAEGKLLEAFLQHLSAKFEEEKERLDELIRKLMNFEPIAAMMEDSVQVASLVERNS